ncbi:MAG: hypothetical protein AAF589_01625 [Planctomycetota bacterium]
MKIDPSTAEITVVGDIGFDNIFSLAFDSDSNKLYGFSETIASDFSSSSSQLVEIDLTSGAGVAVGSPRVPPLWPEAIGGLTYDSGSGELLAANADLTNTIVDLLGISPETGVASNLGDIEDPSFNFSVAFVSALAYEPASDLLYGYESLAGLRFFSLDPQTLFADQIGGVEFDRNIDGMAFDADGQTMYAVEEELFLTEDSFTLVTVDLLTGVRTPIGSLDIDSSSRLFGLAYVGVVPESSSLVIAGVLAAYAAGCRLPGRAHR